jgi:hypothetical protein
MKKLFRSLRSWFKPQPTITLELSDNGFYVVRCYGQYLLTTVTKDKEAADIFFNAIIQLAKKEKSNAVVIKSSNF